MPQPRPTTRRPRGELSIERVRQLATTEDYLTPEEVARLYRVPRRTIYALVDKGAIEVRRVGRYVRIPAKVALALKLSPGLT